MDYKAFGDGKAPGAALTAAGRRWWTMGGEEAAGAITANLKTLKDQQSKRIAQHMVSARLYGNMSILGLAGLTYSKLASLQPGLKDRISYNVAQSCVDTCQAKMAKNKPKPFFLTSGGDYKTQRKAKKLNQLMDGVFYEMNADDMSLEAFRDGEVFGDGIVHVFEKCDRVCWERVLPSELYVDEVEAFYGKPRQMHYVKEVDRDELLALFPGAKSTIKNAQSQDEVSSSATQKIADMVTVRESWRLPSKPGAEDGKHIITVDGKALMPMEPWKHDFFPFARFQWCPRLWGYWSQGGVEQIQNIQLEINKLLWVIQRSFHLAGSFKVFIENGSKIVKEHINNDIGAIVNYTGTPPQYVVPSSVAPEVFGHLLTLKAAAYEQFGISQLNATSQKPAGLNSGKALREYDDIGSDRFGTVYARYQRFRMDLAKLSIAVMRDIAEANGGHYKAKVPGKKFLQSIDWKDIDLTDDEYVMQCFPVSSLPTDPEGRLQTIQEYAQAGYITPRQARKLLDFPDLDQVESLANAQEEYVTSVLDKIVDEGEYTAPEPNDDLSLATELAAEFYAQGKLNGLDEERLEMLRTFMSQCGTLMDMAAAAMTPPPMPGAMTGTSPPIAAPMAPPQSDLLPFGAGAAPPTIQ